MLKQFLLEKGITIKLDSAYRSLEEQQNIFNDITLKYGSDYANEIVAPVGCSEHHTGLAIDITLIIDNVLIDNNFELMKYENIFLEIHKTLSRFGFILRYPKNKENLTGYPYEPWHFRYVGIENAKEISMNNLCLEEYINM